MHHGLTVGPPQRRADDNYGNEVDVGEAVVDNTIKNKGIFSQRDFKVRRCSKGAVHKTREPAAASIQMERTEENLMRGKNAGGKS